MAQTAEGELVDDFEQFYRNYYRDEVAALAQRYPNEQRSLTIDWQDLYRFDSDLADDYLAQPEQLREYAEEALRLYDLPIDVSLGQAHVRIRNLPEVTEIRDIRSRDVNSLVSVRGIIRKATEVRPKIEEAAFECQRCGTISYIPQSGQFQEPHECQGCERQGPFSINYDQSQFVDAQKLRVQESPEGLRGGETPQSIDIHIEDDITGLVNPGDHVTVTGTLRIEQQQQGNQKTRMFDVFMDGHSLVVEDTEFENMDITDADRQAIVELSKSDDIFEKMIGSIAPSIYGYDEIKLAMTLQLFSGVTKHLPDESRIRGDFHILLVGDPGTAKSQLLQYIQHISPRSVYTSGKGSSSAGLCVTGDTRVHTATGFRKIRDLVGSALPTPVSTETAVPSDLDLYSFDKTTDTIRQASASHNWRMPKKPCRRIETTNGFELEASLRTPVLCATPDGVEWVPIAAVEPGDQIARPYYQEVSRPVLRVDSFFALDAGEATLTSPSSQPLRELLRDAFGSISTVATRLDISESMLASGEESVTLPAQSVDQVYRILEDSPAEITITRIDPPAGAPIEIPAEFDDQLGYLIGLVLGAGTLLEPSQSEPGIRLEDNNSRLLEWVQELLELNFGYTAPIDNPGEEIYRLEITSNPLTRFFTNIGLRTSDEDTRLADRLTTSAVGKAVVEGLFATSASVEANRTERQLSFETASAELASQVQLMLSTYNITATNPTTIETPTQGTSAECTTHTESVRHRLRIEGDDLVRLREEISGELMAFLNDPPPVPTDFNQQPGRSKHGDLPVSVKARNALESPQLTDEQPDREPRPTPTSIHAGPTSTADPDLRTLEWEVVETASHTGLKEVFDVSVPGTHNFIGNGLVTHNTAAAVRDDFSEGSEWTLEAGALVLADKGIAAVDELDKMNADDRSAMHEALEQQSISISKAGINATLKSRCSLLGAANPKYGRFDQYEPIYEQIELDPALISRFDLIFTVTDQPNEEKDRELAEHILNTNYVGELNTQMVELTTPSVPQSEVEEKSAETQPIIEPELLRKYIAHAKTTCYPTLSDEAKETIQEFYVDLRSQGASDEAPVPVTARKLEALIRLSEASARVRLSDTVTKADADRVIRIVRSCLEDIGVDPETGQFDADIIETGTTKSQRDRIKDLVSLIDDMETEYENGVPLEAIFDRADELGMDESKVEHEIDNLKTRGELYEPATNQFRTT